MYSPLQINAKPEMLPRTGPEDITVRSEILQKRQKELGWTYYRLGKEVARIRNEYWGDGIEDHRSITNSVKDAVLNPDKARTRQVEAIVIALGGTVRIDWETPVTIIETRTEVFSINTSDQTETENP